MNEFLRKIKLIVILLLLVAITSLPGCKKDKDHLVSSNIKIDVEEEKKDSNKVSKDEIERPDMREDFEKAKKQNSDTVAWLKIPNTTIDYPVVQDLQKRGAVGGEHYYEHRDFMGNRVAVGRESAIMSVNKNVLSPFNQLSRNIVISGHNVDLKDNPNGKMFAPLGHFKDIEFSKKTPYIFLTTEDKDLVYQVFASYYSEERFPYFTPKDTEKEMGNMIKEAKERSNFIYDNVDVNDKDKVLTLFTCNYHFGTYRTLGYYRTKYVVQAKLLSDNEKLKAMASVKVNRNAKKVYYTYCAICNKNMTLEKCSANGGLCDNCKKKK